MLGSSRGPRRRSVLMDAGAGIKGPRGPESGPVSEHGRPVLGRGPSRLLVVGP